jgi:hypothetical protein
VAVFALATVAAFGVPLAGLPTLPSRAAAVPAPSGSAEPEFGDRFWKHWGDGRAELAGYDLTFPRYGAPRMGTAVAIFVTETFSHALRVKADPGRHPRADEFPVLKLNLVRDFATGIYDYNLMTSAFVALERRDGRPAGAVTKLSFSSQEWCGNVYAQALFDAGSARVTSHSYFDGEADQERRVAVPAGAVCEDALLVWARGLAAPLLGPGESRRVPIVRSLAVSRLTHVPFALDTAVLSRAASPERVRVPAGSIECDVYRAEITGGRSWTIHVERAEPHRIVAWRTAAGEEGRLRAADRIAYWRANGPDGVALLPKLGLTPRPPHTP